MIDPGIQKISESQIVGNTDNTDFLPSGVYVTMSHSWAKKGTYLIKAKAPLPALSRRLMILVLPHLKKLNTAKAIGCKDSRGLVNSDSLFCRFH
jgi:hypothetical protein